MISIFRINIDSIASEMTTRPVGAQARRSIINLLRDYESIEIDFGTRSLTPSFADECVGQLAAEIGLASFRSRITLLNLSESSKPLIKHVILTRCNETRHAHA